MAISAMPSGENMAAIEARPTDRIAVPSARNAAPAVCKAPAILKPRAIAKTALAAFPAPLAIAVAFATTEARAADIAAVHLAPNCGNAAAIDDKPLVRPVRIAVPTCAHDKARNVLNAAIARCVKAENIPLLIIARNAVIALCDPLNAT